MKIYVGHGAVSADHQPGTHRIVLASALEPKQTIDVGSTDGLMFYRVRVKDLRRWAKEAGISVPQLRVIRTEEEALKAATVPVTV